MPGRPCLARPIAVTKEEALVGRALLLHCFPLEEIAVHVLVPARSVRGFHTQVQLREPGYVGEIDAGPEGGTPRRTDGVDVIVRKRVGVEGKPVAHKRQPVGEVKAAEARARIEAGELILCARPRRR